MIERCLKVVSLHCLTFGINQILVCCSASALFFAMILLTKPDFIEVYDDSISVLNSYQGAPFQQALSGLTNINNNWYDAKDYATYSFYYQPGPKGQITWSVADVPAWKLDARAIGPNGNVGQGYTNGTHGYGHEFWYVHWILRHQHRWYYGHFTRDNALRLRSDLPEAR